MSKQLRCVLAVLALLWAGLPLGAQTVGKITVSGYITDAASGETLIGAGVLLRREGKPIGAVTNNFGYYSLTLPEGTLKPGEALVLTYSYVGYEEVVKTLEPAPEITVDVTLHASASISEATVVASKEAGIQSSYLGAVEVPLKQIQNTPVLFGESDVLKAIQLMPGVQGGNEGFAGLYVRGGCPEENLILLDGVPIYNVDHVMGLFSVFQPEAVKKVTLYKGSFPARYGGRISSIIDIRTNDGNMKETHGSLGIGLISDKFHLEGPVIKDKLSYSVSARGMHTALYAPIIEAVLKDQYYNYFFYDLTGKVTWRLGSSDRLYFGAYNGADVFTYYEKYKGEGTSYYGDTRSDYRYTSRDGMDIRWGNTVGSVRWNHIFGSRLFSNATLSYNRYRMGMGSSSTEKGARNGVPYSERFDINYNSGIQDWGAKMDFDYSPVPSHLVKFGAEYIYHTFIPETLSTINQEFGTGSAQIDTTLHLIDNKRYHGHDISVYVEDDMSIGKHLTINPGVHLSLFRTDGRNYLSLQPRVSAKYSLDAGVSFKAGYARMAQYVHLLSSAQLSLPIDLWVPITKNIRPVTSDQYSAGVYYDAVKGWEFSVEGYWKAMNNLLEYKDGTIVLGNSGGWENKVEMGRGRAMGLEFFIQKTAGKTTGWVAYTLAKSDREFPEINMGRRFPYKYDRRHSLDISLNHEFSKKVDVNLTWSFASGGTTTLPMRRTVVIDLYGGTSSADFVQSRNNYRLPPSHRLNAGVNFHRQKRHGESVWNISVYNMYNQMNPNFVFFTTESEYDEAAQVYQTRMALKKITILPILPSVGYTFKF